MDSEPASTVQRSTSSPARISIISDPASPLRRCVLHRLWASAARLLTPTFGNATARQAQINVRSLASHVGSAWRLRAGASAPKPGSFERAFAADYHGPDGLWGFQPPTGSGERGCSSQQRSPVVSLAPLTEAFDLLAAAQVSDAMPVACPFRRDVTRPKSVAMNVYSARRFFEGCGGHRSASCSGRGNETRGLDLRRRRIVDVRRPDGSLAAAAPTRVVRELRPTTCMSLWPCI